ncbi:hypothetical protein vseg_014732 [Gypsophila vaccaria]
MTAISEVAPAGTTTLDPQKARMARRRRIEINKLKSTCKDHQHSNDDAIYRNNSSSTSNSSSSSSSSSESSESSNNEVRSSSSSRRMVDTCGAQYGVVSVMGRRREMEDTVSVHRGFARVGPARYDFYGVFDGHGGRHVAEACRDRVHVVIAEEMTGDTGADTWGKGEWGGVMERSFERVDGEVCGGRKAEEVEEMTVGSTAVAVVVGEDVVVVANCGDSRAVLCRDGLAVPLSTDHKPDRPDELARIEAAGGRVINWNGHRVLGVLATSRSIGDHYLKPYVSATPEITITQRTGKDEFLILASDGLWDVITNEVACNVVRRCLAGKIQRKTQELANGICKRNSSRAEIAAALLTELALAKGSKDNISIIVVELRKSRRLTCS